MRHLLVLGLLLASSSAVWANADLRKELANKASQQGVSLDELLREHDLEAPADGAIGQYLQAKAEGRSIPAWLDRQMNRPGALQNRVGGNTDADAVVINLVAGGDPYEDSGSTVGLSDHTTAACTIGTSSIGCSTTISNTAPDAWYSLTVDTPLSCVANLCGSSYDTKLYIFNSELVMVAGNDDSCGAQSEISCNLPAGDYYIVVDGYNSNSGDYTLSVELVDICADYNDAVLSLSSVPGSISGSTVDAPSIFGSAAGDVGIDIVIPTTGNWDFGSCNEGTDFSTDLYLFDANPCEGGELLLSNEYWAGCTDPSGAAKITALDLAAGTYHLVVSNTGTSEGAFEINVEPTPEAPTSGGPDEYGYIWATSDDAEGPEYEWLEINGSGEIAGTQISGMSDVNCVGPIVLPFTFNFYGINYDSLWIGSNGLVGFNNTVTADGNQNMPNATSPNGLIAGFWDDLDLGDGRGAVYTYYDEGNDRFIVEYDGAPDYPGGTGAQNWFQFHLYSDRSIEIHYMDLQGDRTSCSVGMENEEGTVGLTALYNDTGFLLGNEMAIRFSQLPGDFAPPQIVHTPIVSVETEYAGGIPASVELFDDSDIQRASLYYQLNGAAHTDSTAFAHESGDTWTTTIPMLSAGTIVNYWITAWDDAPDHNYRVSESWSFEVVSYAWPPRNLVATDGELDATWISWDAPAPVAEEGDYFENFESGIPTNWTVYDVDGTNYVWQQYEPTDANGAYEGSYVAGVRYETYGSPSDEWLVTQALQASSESRLVLAARSMYTYTLASGDVVVATGNDLESLQNASVIASTEALSDGAWGQLFIDLSTYAGQEIYLAFHFTGSNGGIYIDDVRFYDLAETPARSGHIPNPGCITGISPEDLMREYGLSREAAKQRILDWERAAAHRDTRNFQQYVVYRNGIELGRTTDLFFEDTAALGSQPGVIYEYTTTAMFDSGESDESNMDQGSWTGRPTSGGPDEMGYAWYASTDPEGPSYNWVEINTTGTEVDSLTDVNAVGPFALPFSFPFYGSSYTQIYIGSNGLIGFNSAITSDTNQLLPSTTSPSNLIAGFWDDLDLGDGRGAVYYLNDSANDRLIIEYDGAPDYPGGTGAQNYFQFHLYADGSVEIHYQALNGDITSCTVGMENEDGTVGLTAVYNNDGCLLETPMAIRFAQLEGDFIAPVIVHEPLISTETETAGDILITAEITDADSDVDHAELYYSTGGGFTEVSMTNTTGNTYTGSIPHQALNTTVSYYLQATDDSDRQNVRITDTYDFLVMSCEWAPQNVQASDGDLGTVTVSWDTPWGEMFFGSDFQLSGEELMQRYGYSKEEAIVAYERMHSPYLDQANRNFIMYHVLRDGSEIATTSELSYVDDSTMGGVTYTYTVSAEYDACTSDPSDGDTGYALETGGPDEFGYTWRDSSDPLGPTYGWIEINSLGTAVELTDDDVTDGVFIGFPFPFYGTEYDSIFIGSNGVLGFATEGITSWTAMQSLPDTDTPNNLIAPFWVDLDPSYGVGQILYYYDEGNNRFIVEYDGVPDYDSNDEGLQNWFQTILYPNGNILVNYQSLLGEVSEVYVGIENADGTIGLMYSEEGTITPLESEVSLMFYGPINCDPVVCSGDDETEPNDGWDGDAYTANSIENGDTICGTLQMDGDTANPDYFLYHHFGGQLAIQTDVSDFDAVLRVLESEQDGAVLYEVDNWERCGNESLAIPGLDNGDYFIVVDHNNDADPIVGNQTYSLTVIASGDPCAGHEPISCDGTPEVEPNEGWNSDPVSYNEIGNDVTVCGTIDRVDGEEDSDWYHFTVTSMVDVTLSAAIDEFDAVLFLTDFDPDGSVLAQEDFGPSCYPETLEYIGLPAGEYYAVISCVDDVDFSAENYSLNLHFSDTVVGEPCGDLVVVGNLVDAYTADRSAPVLTHQDGNNCPDAGHAMGLDDVFQVTLTSATTLRITMQGEGNADEVIYLMGDCAVATSCGAIQNEFGAGGEPEVLEISGLPARTYYVVADFANPGETAPYTITIDDVLDVDTNVVYDFELMGNHPNPFNPTTTISWTQPDLAEVRLQVWNLLGETVANLRLGTLRAGRHEFIWDASQLSSGMYIYRLEAGTNAAQSKLMVIK